MYSLSVKRTFTAQHFLIGGDFGEENDWHSHYYTVEVMISGDKLDEHGYLVDITDIEQNMEKLINEYKDTTLNELPEFQGLNPSLEHFARIMHNTLSSMINMKNLSSLSVKLWEDENTWAEYTE